MSFHLLDHNSQNSQHLIGVNLWLWIIINPEHTRKLKEAFSFLIHLLNFCVDNIVFALKSSIDNP